MEWQKCNMLILLRLFVKRHETQHHAETGEQGLSCPQPLRPGCLLLNVMQWMRVSFTCVMISYACRNSFTEFRAHLLMTAIPVPRHIFVLMDGTSYSYVELKSPMTAECAGQNCWMKDKKCFVTTRMSVMQRGSAFQTMGEHCPHLTPLLEGIRGRQRGNTCR